MVNTDSCNDSSHRCDLSSKELAEIPHHLQFHLNLQSLNLNFNCLTSLSFSSLPCLSNLTILSVNGNQLTFVPENIENLKNLKELYVNENILKCLPNTIGQLKKLEIFHATGNYLTLLPDEFSELICLKEVFLDENKLQLLPPEFGNLKNLKTLDISYNAIKYLPHTFGNLTNLTSLSLCNNKLNELPESFCHLKNIKVLDLDGNFIKLLQDDFESAEVLEEFYFSNNYISDVPAWFNRLKKLKKLCLENNLLIAAPFHENFGLDCPKLEYLNLSGNQIEKLPESFGLLKNLKFFDIGSSYEELERSLTLSNGNKLCTLPLNFGNLQCLTELLLDENEINVLPDEFGLLSQLKMLNLAHNNITWLPGSFSKLSSLTVCILSMNYIEILSEDLGNLVNLEDLRLDSNLLKDIPASFSKLTNLQVLDLFNNNLQVLPDCINSLKKLKTLALRENNFDVPFDELPEILDLPPQYNASVKKVGRFRAKPRDDVFPDCIEKEDASKIKDDVEKGNMISNESERDSTTKSSQMEESWDKINGYCDDEDNEKDCKEENYSEDSNEYKAFDCGDDSDIESYSSETYEPPVIYPTDETQEEEVWELADDPSNPYSYFLESDDESLKSSECSLPRNYKKVNKLSLTYEPSWQYPPSVVPKCNTYFTEMPGQFDDAEDDL